MAFVLYDVLPTELVWEIEKQMQKLCIQDVVNELKLIRKQKMGIENINTQIKQISGFIKRNIEDSYYEWYLDFATGRKNMWEECVTDEQLLEFYPANFVGGITPENREIMYNLMNEWYDDTIFRDNDIIAYDDFRTGIWEVEPVWW